MHCPLHRQSRSPLHRPALILSQLNDDEIQTTYTVPQQQVTRLSSDLVVLAPMVHQPLDLLWRVVMPVVLVPAALGLAVFEGFKELGVEG